MLKGAVIRGAVKAERFPLGLMCALGCADVVTSVEFTMLLIAMPKVVRLYGNPVSAFWVLTIYYLVGASSVTLSARLGDLFGRKRMLLGVVAVSLFGSLLSGLSNSFAMLLLGRAITGIATAATPLCFGLIREHFPKSRVAYGVSIAAALPAVAAGIALMSAGVLVDHFPWRFIFAVSAALAVISLIVVYYVVDADRQPLAAHKIDWLGGLLMVPAVAGLLGTVDIARFWGWGNYIPLTVLAGSLAILLYWIFHELRQTRPLVDIRSLARPQVSLANVAMSLLAMGPLQIGAVMSLLLQQPVWTHAGFGASATLTGLLFLPNSLSGLVAGSWGGRLAARYGARRAALVGACIGAFGWIALAMHHSIRGVFLALVYGASFGSLVLYSGIHNLIVEDCPPERTSETVGVTTVIRLLAFGIGSQVVAFILGWSRIEEHASDGRHYSADVSFELTFWLFAVSAIVSALLIWRISQPLHVRPVRPGLAQK